MTAEQLEELLDGLNDRGAHGCLSKLQGLAPSLARRVIAAERENGSLKAALRINALRMGYSHDDVDAIIREASK